MRLPYTVWLSALLASSLLPLCFPGQPCDSVGVAALRNTDPGLQGQDESLVEDLGLGRPESLLMESWNSLAPGCQPALFPAVWGQLKLHQAECLVLALPQASSLQDLGVLAGISSEQRT